MGSNLIIEMQPAQQLAQQNDLTCYWWHAHLQVERLPPLFINWETWVKSDTVWNADSDWMGYSIPRVKRRGPMGRRIFGFRYYRWPSQIRIAPLSHTHTHSSSHYRTPRSRNGTAPDRIENLALVRPPGQLDVMLVYARYVPKKQRRWWNAVRVIFSCTTSLSLSRDLLWLCTLSTWVADRDGSEIFIFSLLAGHRLREKYFWYLFVCTYFRNGWKCRVQIFQPRKMPNTQHTQKGNEEIGNWRELAVSSCLLDK